MCTKNSKKVSENQHMGVKGLREQTSQEIFELVKGTVSRDFWTDLNFFQHWKCYTDLDPPENGLDPQHSSIISPRSIDLSYLDTSCSEPHVEGRGVSLEYFLSELSDDDLSTGSW